MVNFARQPDDERGAILAEAEFLGGRAFREMVRLGATLEANELVPWNGLGAEPPERRAAWLRAAQALVWLRVERLTRDGLRDGDDPGGTSS